MTPAPWTVLTPSSPPTAVADRACVIGGDIYLDCRPISLERANAVLCEMDDLIADCQANGSDRFIRLGEQIQRERLKLERVIRQARMWASASQPTALPMKEHG